MRCDSSIGLNLLAVIMQARFSTGSQQRQLSVNKRNQQLYEKWILLIVMAKAAGMMRFIYALICSGFMKGIVFFSPSLLEHSIQTIN